MANAKRSSSPAKVSDIKEMFFKDEYKNHCIFLELLTRKGIAANNRSESLGNIMPLQKLSDGEGNKRALVGGSAIQNGMRETCRRKHPRLLNRERVSDETELMVVYTEPGMHDPNRYWDDCERGYLIAASKAKWRDMKKKHPDLKIKRQALWNLSPAISTTYCHGETVLAQSPLTRYKEEDSNDGGKKNKKDTHRNSETSGLRQDEVLITTFSWHADSSLASHSTPSQVFFFKTTLKDIIPELSNVAGNHARYSYDFSPGSVVCRLCRRTSQMFGGNGWKVENIGPCFGDYKVSYPELQKLIIEEPEYYPGSEFFFGGEVVGSMDSDLRSQFEELGVTCCVSVESMMNAILGRVIE